MYVYTHSTSTHSAVVHVDDAICKQFHLPPAPSPPLPGLLLRSSHL